MAGVTIQRLKAASKTLLKGVEVKLLILNPLTLFDLAL